MEMIKSWLATVDGHTTKSICRVLTRSVKQIIKHYTNFQICSIFAANLYHEYTQWDINYDM